MGIFRKSPGKIPLPSVTSSQKASSITDQRGTTSSSREPQDGARDFQHEPKRTATLLSKPGLARTPSVQTRYMNMLLAVDEIPRLDNILSSFFSWILLAGYLVFPGTFTSIQESDALNTETDNENENLVKDAILDAVKHAPLLWIAGACCILGVVGMMWLWVKWGRNYVWLINRIFLPGFLNSIAGLISTLVNVFGQQHGNWSITAKVTAIVTGSCTVVFLLLVGLYDTWALKRLKSHHQEEIGRGDADHSKREGVVGVVKRKVHERPLEPGSVV